MAYPAYTPFHRGGSGPPLVCLHGLTDTWRVWELVLPALERHHDVLALTLPGHAGGPPIAGQVDDRTLADAVELAMDEAGFETAHLVGNSLGGYVALHLAARGRAETVVGFAPAGGWAAGDAAWRRLLLMQRRLIGIARAGAPHADTLLATAEGRRRATRLLTVSYEHIPAELIAHQMLGAAAAPGALDLIDYALEAGWDLEPERIECPVRIAWGTADRLLPWPAAAARYRDEWLPHADWVVLDDVGHCPQLDVPLEAAQLVLGVTAP
jgi:pimeloyl-ACP methyl ester carboxylesterase